MDLQDLCGRARLDRDALRAVFRVGSRVYGTDHPGSDEDFVVVLARQDARQDLLFGPDFNVILHGVDSFQRSLDEPSVLALEAWFAPPPHRLLEPRPPFRCKPDRRRLLAAASERARSDFAKARKTFEDEPEAARKKVFHALRVAMFARQIVRHGKLLRFDEASHLPALLRSFDRWTAIEKHFGPELEALLNAPR
jgi:predicted nucleotidyltransferase